MFLFSQKRIREETDSEDEDQLQASKRSKIDASSDLNDGEVPSTSSAQNSSMPVCKL